MDPNNVDIMNSKWPNYSQPTTRRDPESSWRGADVLAKKKKKGKQDANREFHD